MLQTPTKTLWNPRRIIQRRNTQALKRWRSTFKWVIILRICIICQQRPRTAFKPICLQIKTLIQLLLLIKAQTQLHDKTQTLHQKRHNQRHHHHDNQNF